MLVTWSGRSGPAPRRRCVRATAWSDCLVPHRARWLRPSSRERDRSQKERELLASQVAELEAALIVARRPVEREPVVAAAPVAPAASDLQDALSESQEQLGKLAQALETAKLNESRMRKRMANQEQLYASVRAELEVKKDRLRTQEEQIQRLQAMKVVVGE